MDTAPTSGTPPINWLQPWLEPYQFLSEALQVGRQNSGSVAQTLNTLTAVGSSAKPPVHFVPSTVLPDDEAYEAFIYRTGTVPTRDNLHDLFNGLVWWRFPQAKNRLNALQAAEIAARGVNQVRGALRDSLTLFDENAALLQAPEVLVAALRRRDWWALFVTHRSCWADAKLTLFGHALIEKLVAPRKNITTHVWLLPPGDDLEGLLLKSLSPALLATKPFHPLPVLGVPGWWPENEDFDFYKDETVFRPSSGSTKTP